MILDFICELDRLIAKWPDQASWTLAQIADYTATSVPLVVDYLSDTLDRELEVHETLTLAEAQKALEILSDRMSGQLLAREKHLEELRERAIRAYDATMEKSRVLQATRNWRSAYKTMSYYVGRFEKDLPQEMMLELAGECLRLGVKAETNMQELSLWLKKGIEACTRIGTQESLEAGLDFLDAYSCHFLKDDDGRGRRLVSNSLEYLCRDTDVLQTHQQYTNLLKELGY